MLKIHVFYHMEHSYKFKKQWQIICLNHLEAFYSQQVFEKRMNPLLTCNNIEDKL